MPEMQDKHSGFFKVCHTLEGKSLLRYAVVVVLLCIPFVYADAISGTPQYGIALSKSCLVMISNNVTSQCPTYDQIAAVFTDNTNQRTSGKLDYYNGIFQRGPPNILNPIQEYVFKPVPTLWIDPPGSIRDRIDMITILPSVPEYKIPINSTHMDNYIITFGIDRWINPNCSEIKITANNWVFLTGDGLRLLAHNCDMNYTSFNGTVSHTFEKSYQNLATTSKYKLDEFIKLAKEKYKTSHIGKDVNNNKSVTEDEDQ